MTTMKMRYLIYPVCCMLTTEVFWLLSTGWFNLNKGTAHLSMIVIPLVLATFVGRKFISVKRSPAQAIRKVLLLCGIIPTGLVFMQIGLSWAIINKVLMMPEKSFALEYVMNEIFSWTTVALFILNLPFALSEEMAWRGYYLNILKANQQPLWLVDIGWWLWHIPFLLRGMNFRSELWLSMLFMLMYCLLLGAILRHIRQAGGGFVSVTFVHAMINTLWNLKIGQHLSSRDNIFLGPTGLVSLALLLLTLASYRLIIRNMTGRSLKVVVCDEI